MSLVASLVVALVAGGIAAAAPLAPDPLDTRAELEFFLEGVQGSDTPAKVRGPRGPDVDAYIPPDPALAALDFAPENYVRVIDTNSVPTDVPNESQARAFGPGIRIPFDRGGAGLCAWGSPPLSSLGGPVFVAGLASGLGVELSADPLGGSGVNCGALVLGRFRVCGVERRRLERVRPWIFGGASLLTGIVIAGGAFFLAALRSRSARAEGADVRRQD